MEEKAKRKPIVVIDVQYDFISPYFSWRLMKLFSNVQIKPDRHMPPVTHCTSTETYSN